MSETATVRPTQDRIHTWFSLSYSNYLVLNRALLQSMPDAWQEQFVKLLDEMDRAFDHVEKAEGYEVTAGRWPYIEECTDAELKAAGITQCKEDPDTFHNANGDELTATDYAFVPGRDPVPHYNRGRTYIQPGPPAITG